MIQWAERLGDFPEEASDMEFEWEEYDQCREECGYSTDEWEPLKATIWNICSETADISISGYGNRI